MARIEFDMLIARFGFTQFMDFLQSLESHNFFVFYLIESLLVPKVLSRSHLQLSCLARDKIPAFWRFGDLYNRCTKCCMSKISLGFPKIDLGSKNLDNVFPRSILDP